MSGSCSGRGCCARRIGPAPTKVPDRSAPTGGASLFWWGCGCPVRAAGGACPAPTKVPDNPRTQERSVTWRSDLLIDLTFTHKNMPTPGPGPQARCGKGEGSGEGLGDRCRVPRSSPPSGAGREPLKFLRRNQLDDHTKGPRRCGGYTSSVGFADTFPSRGRQRRTRPAGLHLIRRLRRHLPL